MKALVAITVLSLCVTGWGQTFEDWVETAADPEELQGWLDDLRQNPLDLNRAASTEIALLPFMDEAATREIVEERSRLGSFADMAEVLRLPILSREQRESLRQLACIRVNRNVARTNALISADSRRNSTPESWWGKGRINFQAEGGQRGFVYVRRQTDDPTLFDRACAGLEFTLPEIQSRVVAGDYQFEAGTGLVFASASGMGSWLTAVDATKPSEQHGLVLRPAVSRRSLFRGAAVDSRVMFLHVTAVGSWNRIDGAVGGDGADHLTEGTSGSTALDLARRDQIEERLAGVCLQTEHRWWQAGIATYSAHYSPKFIPTLSSTSPFEFSGSTLNTGSLFFRLDYSGLDAVAEVAQSNPGGRAFQGAMSASSTRAGITIYHSQADADFYSFHSQIWNGASGGGNTNVTGVKVHANWSNHSLAISAQTGKTPFRTATSPLSRDASDVEARWTSTLEKPLEIELLGRRGWSEETSELMPSQWVKVDRGRVEVRWRDEQEFIARFEVRASHREGEAVQGLGTLLFFQTKTRLLENDLTARLTFFNLKDDPGLPLQIYEGGIAGAYPLASMSGTGRRVTMVVAHDWHPLKVSAQIAHSAYRASGSDQDRLDLAVGLSYRR